MSENMKAILELLKPNFVIAEMDPLPDGGKTFQVSAPGANVGVRIAEGTVEAAMNAGMKAEEIVDQIVEKLKETRQLEEYSKKVRDFGEMSSRMIFTAINAEKNQDLLEKVPHLRFHDLAGVVRIVFQENPFLSALVNHEMLRTWGISESEFFTRMQLDIEGRNPVTMARLDSFLNTLCEEEGYDYIVPDDDMNDKLYLVRASEYDGMFGAGALFYPSFTEVCRETLGDHFIVIPSSIHEVIAVQATGGKNERDDIRKMVYDVNRTLLNPNEFLSDSIYVCKNGMWVRA